jgi:hypothetical protein
MLLVLALKRQRMSSTCAARFSVFPLSRETCFAMRSALQNSLHIPCRWMRSNDADERPFGSFAGSF